MSLQVFPFIKPLMTSTEIQIIGCKMPIAAINQPQTIKYLLLIIRTVKCSCGYLLYMSDNFYPHISILLELPGNKEAPTS